MEAACVFSGQYLELKIRDYGEGAAPEEISFLTSRFFRGSHNTEEKEGSGLGLYIANELMKKMQGELICSNMEDGFCVTLRIPLA